MFTTNTSIMDSLCLHGGDTCDAGNPFDINSTSINSTLLLLCSYPAWVAMLILSASFIIFANLVIKHNQDLRKKINSQQWFLIQMLMHPVIVGGTVYMANITGNEWWGLLGLPFIFNFGAEPMDFTKLPPRVLLIFQLFAYVHHAGPLLACLSCFSIQNNSQFALANSLLYAHAWSLHTLGALDYMKVLRKQKFFWIYMVQALFSTAFWWSSLRKGLEEVTLSAVFPLLVGPIFQYGGRWGLYEYIRYCRGYPVAGDDKYDAFETRKQMGELTAFALGALLVFVEF